MGATLSQLNNRLSYDFVNYLQDRSDLSRQFRSIASSAALLRQRKGRLQVVNGSAGLVAGVAGATALSLAAAPLTLGLSVPLHAAATASIVGNTIAAASITSSAASFGFGHAGDQDIARRLQNLKADIECIAKKDDEVNSLLLRKKTRNLQACRGLCNIWDEWDLAQRKDTKSALAFDLPMHIFKSQGIIFGTKSIIDGTKKVQDQNHDLETALLQAAESIDSETSLLRKLANNHYFRFWSCIPEERHLSRGRLTYIDGGGGCKRVMLATYYLGKGGMQVQQGKQPMKIKSDSTNVIYLPEGATNIKIHFLVKGGSTVKKVDRSNPKQPWVKDEVTKEYQIDYFDLDYGDGVDAVFLLRGSLTHTYVHKAWNFGQHPITGLRKKWEWWPGAEEECEKLLPDIGLRSLHRTQYEHRPSLGLASCGSCFGQDTATLATIA